MSSQSISGGGGGMKTRRQEGRRSAIGVGDIVGSGVAAIVGVGDAVGVEELASVA